MFLMSKINLGYSGCFKIDLFDPFHKFLTLLWVMVSNKI